MNGKNYIDRWGKTHVPDENAVIRPRAGAFSLMIARGHILLCAPQTAPDVLEIPGGGIDQGETERQAMEREFYEETGLVFPQGITPSAEHRQHIKFYADNHDEYWRYDQLWQRFDLPDDTPLWFSGRRGTPENGKAFWQPLEKMDEVVLHYVHKNITTKLI